ncbi:MAG: hypothetical protein HGA93_02255, partial [Methanothrix sp.]|nr:hypothetical protein [Methanothrix sp.]
KYLVNGTKTFIPNGNIAHYSVLAATTDPTLGYKGVITLIVDMVAPKYSGYYSTTWGIVSGNTTLCSLPAQIYVK